jgi:DNA (cytosine-5)-methyltransferase 1
MGDAIMTVDSSNRYGLASASLVEYYGNGKPLDVSEPMHTVTAHDREALISAHIQKYFDGGYKGCGNSARDPLSTVTVEPRHGVCAAHVVEFKGQDIGQPADKPLRTITASWGEFAQCRAVLTKTSGTDLGYWPEIRKLLNTYCGYSLADDEIILLIIGGIAYFISDITLRMLTPRELYNAMGFPPDYIIERDYLGNAYPKNKQVARCGNAVCPPMAEAMVRANLPEHCGVTIVTMAQLNDLVAV